LRDFPSTIAKNLRRDPHRFSIMPAPFNHHPQPQTSTAIKRCAPLPQTAERNSKQRFAQQCLNKPNE
jgi:hypothetical protein